MTTFDGNIRWIFIPFSSQLYYTKKGQQVKTYLLPHILLRRSDSNE